MPEFCEHIFFCHSNLTVVTHCYYIMQVFEFNIIMVIFTLLVHAIVSFHK